MDFLNTSQYTEAFIYLYEWVKGSSPNFNSHINLLSTNPKKWSNTLKQFVGNSRQCLSVFEDFVGFAHKDLIECKQIN